MRCRRTNAPEAWGACSVCCYRWGKGQAVTSGGGWVTTTSCFAVKHSQISGMVVPGMVVEGSVGIVVSYTPIVPGKHEAVA